MHMTTHTTTITTHFKRPSGWISLRKPRMASGVCVAAGSRSIMVIICARREAHAVNTLSLI